MPLRPAAILAVIYALGYPIGALAVSAMSPMSVLMFRFSLSALFLGVWAVASGVRWPTGALLGHVLVAGLLTQGLQFGCLYLALMRGAPAVLGAVMISMNPVATALLAAMFLGERLTARRMAALMLGVLAVLAACAQRLLAVGGVDTVTVLLVVSLLAIASGGVYQQRFCRGVDFRANATLQNAAALVPVSILAAILPWQVTNVHLAIVGVTAVVLLNSTLCMTMYVRAIDRYGAASVAVLFAVIPAIAGVLSWLILGQRPDGGIAVGLVLGALACRLNTSGSPGIERSEGGSRQQRQYDPADDRRRQHRVDAVHDPAVAG
jgi:drug/metabolite transporter (DMT)-like permease